MRIYESENLRMNIHKIANCVAAVSNDVVNAIDMKKLLFMFSSDATSFCFGHRRDILFTSC